MYNCISIILKLFSFVLLIIYEPLKMQFHSVDCGADSSNIRANWARIFSSRRITHWSAWRGLDRWFHHPRQGPADLARIIHAMEPLLDSRQTNLKRFNDKKLKKKKKIRKKVSDSWLRIFKTFHDLSKRIK